MLLAPNMVTPTRGLVSAPVTAMSTSPPRTRALSPPIVTSMVARLSGLATSRLARVCDRRSAAPDRVTPRWASPTRPRSSMRASGPVCRISSVVMVASLCSPELDPHARRQQRRIGPIDVPQHRIGVPDQMPSAGGAARGDSGEFAGQAHRTGRDRWAWLGPSRYGQTWVAVDQIGETRCKPAESDHPWVGGVSVDDLCGVHSGELADLGEVGAVVDDVDHRGLGRRGRRGVGRERHRAEPTADGALPAGPVEFEQPRTRGRDDVEDTGHRDLTQCTRPRQYLGGAVELQQQGLIAVVENGVGQAATHYSTGTRGDADFQRSGLM